MPSRAGARTDLVIWRKAGSRLSWRSREEIRSRPRRRDARVRGPHKSAVPPLVHPNIWSLRVSIVGPASQPDAADYERTAGVAFSPILENRMMCDYARAGREPALEELLCDPVMQLVMRRNGLAPADVHRVVNAARWRLSPPRDAEDQTAGRARRRIAPGRTR
jgi:hypothetical protein